MKGHRMGRGFAFDSQLWSFGPKARKSGGASGWCWDTFGKAGRR